MQDLFQTYQRPITLRNVTVPGCLDWRKTVTLW